MYNVKVDEGRLKYKLQGYKDNFLPTNVTKNNR